MNNNNVNASPVVFWVIWAAILNGLIIMQIFVGGGIPTGEDQGSAPFLFVSISLALALASTLIRWFVIPKIKSLTALMPAMIIALALGEGGGLLSIFAIPSEFPQTKLILLGVSILCVLQLAPIYTKGKKQ